MKSIHENFARRALVCTNLLPVPRGYSGFQVTVMIEGFFVGGLKFSISGYFLGRKILAIIFLGSLI